MSKRAAYRTELSKRLPYGLDHFLFSRQAQVFKPTLSFLKEWSQWKYDWLEAQFAKMRGEEEVLVEKPATTLHLWGPTETGKTRLAHGIARFLALNMRFLHVEHIVWPDLVRDFDRVKEIDWLSPDVLILDRFDRWKPQQRHPSTYILQLMGLPFARTMPTILITNRDLGSLKSWMAKDIYGNGENSESKGYADAVFSDIYRQLADSIKFNEQDLPGFAGGRNMRKKAKRENDMFAFDFVEEYTNREVWF